MSPSYWFLAEQDTPDFWEFENLIIRKKSPKLKESMEAYIYMPILLCFLSYLVLHIQQQDKIRNDSGEIAIVSTFLWVSTIVVYYQCHWDFPKLYCLSYGQKERIVVNNFTNRRTNCARLSFSLIMLDVVWLATQRCHALNSFLVLGFFVVEINIRLF